jgi:hypothetical protein
MQGICRRGENTIGIIGTMGIIGIKIPQKNVCD